MRATCRRFEIARSETLTEDGTRNAEFPDGRDLPLWYSLRGLKAATSRAHSKTLALGFLFNKYRHFLRNPTSKLFVMSQNKRRTPHFLSLLICTTLWTATCWSAHGATVRTLDLPQIAQQADVIVDATVQTVNSYWVAPAGVKSIRTRVNFTVNAMIKGPPTPSLSLEFLGGEVGDRGLRVPGVPKFAVGERYILFSNSPEKSMVSPVVGMEQGALRVVHDSESQVDRVYRYWGQPVSAQVDFKSRVPATAGATTRTDLRSADTVDQFAGRVRQLLNR